jgi:hypothetical protein
MNIIVTPDKKVNTFNQLFHYHNVAELLQVWTSQENKNSGAFAPE